MAHQMLDAGKESPEALAAVRALARATELDAQKMVADADAGVARIMRELEESPNPLMRELHSLPADGLDADGLIGLAEERMKELHARGAR